MRGSVLAEAQAGQRSRVLTWAPSVGPGNRESSAPVIGKTSSRPTQPCWQASDWSSPEPGDSSDRDSTDGIAGTGRVQGTLGRGGSSTDVPAGYTPSGSTSFGFTDTTYALTSAQVAAGTLMGA